MAPTVIMIRNQKFSINCPRSKAGVVLVELLLVVALIGMMTGIAVISFGAMWGNLRFKRQADELVHVF